MQAAAGGQTCSGPCARAAAMQALQGSTGGPLGAAGGQWSGITSQTTQLPSATVWSQAGGRWPALPQGRHAASQYSAALQGSVLLSGSSRACPIRAHQALQHQHCFLGMALFAAPPTPHPLHAGLSAGAILHLLFALLLPRGQVWARAKHQLRQAHVPQTCHEAVDRTQSPPAAAKCPSLCS